MSGTGRRTRQRIVSLAPSVTSILVGLGVRRELVAVSKWCADVAPVDGLPRLGDCWAVEIEPLRKLRPTIVIGSVPFRSEAVEKLLALPAAFLALNPRSLADIEDNIRTLGRIARREARAEKLIREFQRGFARVRQAARKAKSRPRVYAEAWPNPRISSPPWVAELIEIAGGEMAVRAGERIDDEEVARARPEVIVLAWTATRDRAEASQALRNPAWQEVPAVRDRRVVVVRDELLNTPGPPLVEGATELLRAFHPELARAKTPARAS